MQRTMESCPLRGGSFFGLWGEALPRFGAEVSAKMGTMPFENEKYSLAG